MGGWIADFQDSDGYSFVSEDFPKDKVVGFGCPDEFINPIMLSNSPGDMKDAIKVGVGGSDEFINPVIVTENPGDATEAIKIGVGRINLFRPGNYRFTEEPGLIEIFPWVIEEGRDSIQFTQEALKGGLGYRLIKEIRLHTDVDIEVERESGFTISYNLKNLSHERPIQTLWYYHPFVAPGGMGSNCFIDLPDTLRPTFDFVKPLTKDSEGRLRLPDDFTEIKTQLLEFTPADMGHLNRFVVGNVNHKKALIIEGDFPLAFLRVWYEPRTFSPEPFYHITLSAGDEISWSVKNTIAINPNRK